jgi:hypothetical protein
MTTYTMNPRTPAEALRWAANSAQAAALLSEGAAMRLDDDGFSDASIARGESRVLRKLYLSLLAEAERLEALATP